MASTIRLSVSGADCKVCFQAYDAGWRRPRALPCGHTFCSLCMASIIKEKRLTCPGCQAQHSVEIVTQLPVNYELESLLKLQPVPEAEYYHDKAGPISLSDVMCSEHNCDVYLRCVTHKTWICQQCTTDDHPINKCKIISISEELEVRKESLLMFLNEEYEQSVQSLLRVRQSLAQVEDESKKHEEVVGHLAEIILQHRDEQGHLEVHREALEQSIEDLKDKAWVLDQATLNLQDALSVQEIVASCQEAQSNLAYIKDLADVSNIEQQSMDSILHSYKIRATTSMGLHAIHGTNSTNNDEPDKPTTSDHNDADKKQTSHKQDNNGDTDMNQKDNKPSGTSKPALKSTINKESQPYSQNPPVSYNNKSNVQNTATNKNKSDYQNTATFPVSKSSNQNTGLSNLKQIQSHNRVSYKDLASNDERSHLSINSMQKNQICSTTSASSQYQAPKGTQSRPVTFGSILKSDWSCPTYKPPISSLSSPTSSHPPSMAPPAAPPRERPSLFSPRPGALIKPQSTVQSETPSSLTQTTDSYLFSPIPQNNSQSSTYSSGTRALSPVTRPLSPLTYIQPARTIPSQSTTMRSSSSSSSRTSLALHPTPMADQQKTASDYTQRSTSALRQSKLGSSSKSGRLYSYS
ncbi:unnamed protein product [Meganyctiphanes norvegica]|uniref:RING-type domain-containing protein n=1 Tax=Meganyctiphanes norvegica TaxID=48144 RepID=A0AAV2RLJ1_MEGNR